MDHPTPYDERAKWDAARQIKEVSGLFAGYAGSLVRCIDAIYRPALESLESRANEYHDTTMQQATRIAELEAAIVEAGRQLKNMAEDCYQPGALHCSACGLSLSVARDTLAAVES